MRSCRAGAKIGPLYADRGGVAERLLEAFMGAIPAGAQVFLDVPEPNRQALKLVEGRGLAPVFKTARMYTGALPEVEMARLYGIASFELG